MLEALVRQKADWLQTHDKHSWLTDESARGAALLETIVQTALGAGTLHLCWLECAEEIIATHLGFEDQDVLYWYLPTYAARWARFAPGRLMLLKLISWAIDQGLSGFDFMRGEEPYKTRLSSNHLELTEFFFASSHVARLAEPLLMAWLLRGHVGPEDHSSPPLSVGEPAKCAAQRQDARWHA